MLKLLSIPLFFILTSTHILHAKTLLEDGCGADYYVYNQTDYPGPLKSCVSLASSRSGSATESIKCSSDISKQIALGHIVPNVSLVSYRFKVTISSGGKSITCTIGYPNRNYSSLPGLTLKEFLSPVDLKQILQANETFDGVTINNVQALDFGLPEDTPFYNSPTDEIPKIAGSDAYQNVLSCLRHPMAPYLSSGSSALNNCQPYGLCMLVKKGDSIKPGLYIFTNNGHKYIPLSDKELEEWPVSISGHQIKNKIEQKVKDSSIIIDKKIKNYLAEKTVDLLNYSKKDYMEKNPYFKLLSKGPFIKRHDAFLETCKIAAEGDKDLKTMSLKVNEVISSWQSTQPSTNIKSEKNNQ